MKFTQVLLTALIAIASAVGAVKYYAPQGVQTAAQPEKKETVYERVMRTGKLRCGYVLYAPFFIKDPNTKEMSGIFYELTNEITKLLNWEVIWSEETSFASMFPAINAGRFDAVCSGIWANAGRSNHVNFTDAMFYSAVEAYARKDDNRFKNNLKALNDPNVKIATIDGEMSSIIADTDFPLAKKVSLPDLTDISQVLQNIVTKKADVTFVEKAVANEYLMHNSDSIESIAPNNPVGLYANTIMLAPGDYRFIEAVNIAQQELLFNGTVEKIISKYEKVPNSFYRVAKPYQTN